MQLWHLLLRVHVALGSCLFIARKQRNARIHQAYISLRRASHSQRLIQLLSRLKDAGHCSTLALGVIGWMIFSEEEVIDPGRSCHPLGSPRPTIRHP
jgi:hypothetical protein